MWLQQHCLLVSIKLFKNLNHVEGSPQLLLIQLLSTKQYGIPWGSSIKNTNHQINVEQE